MPVSSYERSRQDASGGALYVSGAGRAGQEHELAMSLPVHTYLCRLTPVFQFQCRLGYWLFDNILARKRIGRRRSLRDARQYALPFAGNPPASRAARQRTLTLLAVAADDQDSAAALSPPSFCLIPAIYSCRIRVVCRRFFAMGHTVCSFTPRMAGNRRTFTYSVKSRRRSFGSIRFDLKAARDSAGLKLEGSRDSFRNTPLSC
jgi:hypothetical protein